MKYPSQTRGYRIALNFVMNILLVHNFYQQPGGEDQVFAEEGALLERHGNTVSRFTMDNDAIAQLGKVELARKTIWNKQSQQLLRDKIREIRAEVVHFHNTFPLISPAAYYTAHEEGAAVVQTLHNYRLLCPAATFYRDGGVCEDCLKRAIPWPGVLHKCYRDNRSASAVTAAMLAIHRAKGTWSREVDRYIALTKFAADKFIEGGIPSNKIVVKPNFVDPDPGISDGSGGFFLFVGRLTVEKGISTLLKAWESMQNPVGLKVIGDGPLRKEVEAAAARCATIEYLGRQPPPTVYNMMGSAKALVFPSEWYEGQPRTIIESLAKGTPVIASRLGSMPELVEHGRTGLLFEAGKGDELARQVSQLCADGTNIASMRQAARQEFELRYTAQQNYPLLMEVYRQARA